MVAPPLPHCWLHPCAHLQDAVATFPPRSRRALQVLEGLARLSRSAKLPGAVQGSGHGHDAPGCQVSIVSGAELEHHEGQHEAALEEMMQVDAFVALVAESLARVCQRDSGRWRWFLSGGEETCRRAVRWSLLKMGKGGRERGERRGTEQDLTDLAWIETRDLLCRFLRTLTGTTVPWRGSTRPRPILMQIGRPQTQGGRPRRWWELLWEIDYITSGEDWVREVVCVCVRARACVRVLACVSTHIYPQQTFAEYS